MLDDWADDSSDQPNTLSVTYKVSKLFFDNFQWSRRIWAISEIAIP